MKESRRYDWVTRFDEVLHEGQEERRGRIAQRVGRQHKLARGPLLELVRRIDELRAGPRSLAERDRTSAGEAGRQLRRLDGLLFDAIDRLWWAVLDEVPRRALMRHAPPGVDVQQMKRWIGEATRLAALVQAASMDLSGRSGRPRRPTWHRDAAKLARAFWLEQKGEKAACAFDRRGIEPRNPFSRFFCDLMHEVADVEAKECARALSHRYVPARRG